MNNELNAKQNAKLNMYRTTEQHVDDNAAIAGNPAFQTAFNKFKANNTAIQTVAQQKSATLTGVAADKSNAKQTLCKLAANLAGIVFAYAAANNNETLKQEMNLPVTTLIRTRDEALVPRCQMIHAKATANLSALGDFGIKTTQLDNLQTAIDQYSATTPKPRTAISNRKTVNANLAALFKENDSILNNQIDKLIEFHRTAHSDFVNTYFSARIIVDPPTRARKTGDLEGMKDNEIK